MSTKSKHDAALLREAQVRSLEARLSTENQRLRQQLQRTGLRMPRMPGMGAVSMEIMEPWELLKVAW